MAKYRARIGDVERVTTATMDELLRHVRKYGLDNRASGYRGKPQRYKNYAALAKDTAVEVAFDSFTEDTYAQFIEGIGYGQFADDARTDWIAANDV